MVCVDLAVNQEYSRAGMGVQELGEHGLSRIFRATDALGINPTACAGRIKYRFQLVLNVRISKHVVSV